MNCENSGWFGRGNHCLGRCKEKITLNANYPCYLKRFLSSTFTCLYQKRFLCLSCWQFLVMLKLFWYICTSFLHWKVSGVKWTSNFFFAESEARSSVDWRSRTMSLHEVYEDTTIATYFSVKQSELLISIDQMIKHVATIQVENTIVRFTIWSDSCRKPFSSTTV